MKGGTILGLMTLIVMGTMLGTALANPKGTNALFNGLGGLWKTGLQGIEGKA